MKFYKIENNKFMGFYDSEIHDLFNVTYKEEEKEVEEVIKKVVTDEEGNAITDEDGNEVTEDITEIKIETIQVPIYTLKENYFELSEEKWTELLNGQSEGKEIKILKNGELGLFEKPQPPQEFYRPKWNEIEEEWEEGANKIDLLTERKNLILKYKKLKDEISTLKEMAELDEELASPETIKMLENEVVEVKNKIKELAKVIKSL